MMNLKQGLLFSFILTICLADEINNKKFPDGFMFGTATSSYQIEGAWDEDGKGENIWDHLTHTLSDKVVDGSNGDIAADSYHKYKEDIALLKDLGVDHYRFSLSWTRLLPTGFADSLNEAGITYYKNLISELRSNNIEPLVTIYHWDLPQSIEEFGGWLNESVIDYYTDYARICFEQFGEDVKFWITFNEPKQTCEGGYGSAWMAPLISDSGVSDYICAHNLIRAHAAAYHIYDDEFRSTQNGKVSITLDTSWYEPESNSTEDITAFHTEYAFDFGWYANPIYIGDYPEIMKTRIAEVSATQGYNKSRLPEFTEEEITYIKGTHDFFGLNMYTANMVRAPSQVELEAQAQLGLTANYYSDINVAVYQPDDWEETVSENVKVTPWGMRKLLNYIADTYNSPPILITENGVPEDGSTLNDTIRIEYYQGYISNVRDAIDDGVNVIGYTAWSLIDNFEWLQGYTQKYGIYSVDFSSPNRTRIPKASVEVLKKLFKTRCLVDDCVS